MNEPGTLSRTDTASRTRRLKDLLGPGFTVYMKWRGMPLCWYEITASKEGQYANWTMVDEDFAYTDDELMDKFITPAKGVFK